MLPGRSAFVVAYLLTVWFRWIDAWGGSGARGLRMTMNRLKLQPLTNADQRKTIFLYNTLTRTKEEFKARSGGSSVSFYSCGPTVYDYAHIGNFRAFLTYDVLKRWLQYCGYEVDHVCNLTDVDDKIIVKMAAEGKTLKEVTEKYTAAFFDDLDVLNIQRAQRYPKATEHIKDIEQMIQKLVENGSAYVENGSVYFRVESFKDYGQLANLKFDEMKKGAGGFGPNERRGTNEKESARDFALWKAFTEQDGEVVWDSAFGRGRPGWHIECSAMCNCLLGPTIDLHAGGVDLVFPHHSNEIAQSEAYSGERFCNYWVHNGFVNIDNEKMSKSLKNFKTLRDLAASPFDARALRFMVVTSQYRAPLNFTPDTLKAAASSLQRIDKLVARLEAVAAAAAAAAPNVVDVKAESEAESGATVMATMTRGKDPINLEEAAKTALEAFEAAMCDDLNTPRASAALFGLVGAAEKALNAGLAGAGAGAGSAADSVSITAAISAIRRFDRVFGVLYDVPAGYFAAILSSSSTSTSSTSINGGGGGGGGGDVPAQVMELAKQRAELKAAKKYAEADATRAQIAELGYTVKDKSGGQFDVLKTTV